jgi:hypothetical protein
VSKRDSYQHEFLEPLHEWGNSARHFEFGKGLGHTVLAVTMKGPGQELDDRDTTQVVAVFHAALKAPFKDEFVETIKKDMAVLGYDIEGVLMEKPSTVTLVSSPLSSDLIGISVKERDLRCNTDQTTISGGMFRALSAIIQITYAIMTKRGSLFLIDDVGEGLDFERACAFIRLLKDKVEKSNIQVILTTNNRFVMNEVPLEEWTLLRRAGCKVRALNYENSREVFERFKMTGLNNFDFLATDFPEKVSSNAQVSSIR